MISGNQQKLISFMVDSVEQAAIQYGVARTLVVNCQKDNHVTLELRRQSLARMEIGLKSRKAELATYLESLKENCQ